MIPVPPTPRMPDQFLFRELEIMRKNVNEMAYGNTLCRLIVPSNGTTTALANSDNLIVVTGGQNETLTLPPASDGKGFLIKSRCTGTVTITPNGSDTIDGANSSITLTVNQSATLIALNNDWVLL